FYTVIGVMAVTALAAVLASQVRYDYNLLNMLPRNIESVQWQRRLANAGGRALWFGVSIVDDLDEARRLTQAYREYAANDKTRTIEELGGVAMLFPPDEEAKLAMIDATREQLQPALDAVLQGD